MRKTTTNKQVNRSQIKKYCLTRRRLSSNRSFSGYFDYSDCICTIVSKSPNLMIIYLPEFTNSIFYGNVAAASTVCIRNCIPFSPFPATSTPQTQGLLFIVTGKRVDRDWRSSSSSDNGNCRAQESTRRRWTTLLPNGREKREQEVDW